MSASARSSPRAGHEPDTNGSALCRSPARASVAGLARRRRYVYRGRALRFSSHRASALRAHKEKNAGPALRSGAARLVPAELLPGPAHGITRTAFFEEGILKGTVSRYCKQNRSRQAPQHRGQPPGAFDFTLFSLEVKFFFVGQNLRRINKEYGKRFRAPQPLVLCEKLHGGHHVGSLPL